MADLSLIYDDFGECTKLGNAKRASTSTSEMLTLPFLTGKYCYMLLAKLVRTCRIKRLLTCSFHKSKLALAISLARV
jgi:hypothetical protein